ncbi:hypothetical protein GGR28_001538 [Lewinella aquimaris]|uniref:Uncharacterized protein n=1 Tax=Neolewinella aquimaris TaxID=1835722 RepID=A0A840E136_9BACT|nr:hypothetical protein [Neolewinella aquimaris]MBB4078921.1 hypothetical protein [Neolewinella aquimaris]
MVKNALLLLLSLVLFGCGEDEVVRVQLTPDQREEYQEIASNRLDSLRPLLDSICQATFEDRVAVATDSIVQRRLEEELRLRARLGQTIGQ